MVPPPHPLHPSYSPGGVGGGEISLLQEEKEFDEYYKDIPWAAVPYDFDDREDISESFNIIGVPTFVVVNSKGKLVDAKGKVTILNDGIKAIDKWNEKK